MKHDAFKVILMKSGFTKIINREQPLMYFNFFISINLQMSWNSFLKYGIISFIIIIAFPRYAFQHLRHQWHHIPNIDKIVGCSEIKYYIRKIYSILAICTNPHLNGVLRNLGKAQRDAIPFVCSLVTSLLKIRNL